MTRRQKAIAFFVALCVLLVAAAVSLNIGWIIANAGRITPIILGIVLFALIIAGLIVYTVFLVLEIKRNEEHDSFINAVTHELKTPIASIRCISRRSSRATVRRRAAPGVLRHHAGRRRAAAPHRRSGAEGRRRPREAAGRRARRRSTWRRWPASAWTWRSCAITCSPAPSRSRRRRSRRRWSAATPRSCARSSPTCSTTPSSTPGSDVQVTVSVAAPAPDTVWVRVQDPRRRHPEEAAQAHLQPLLSRAGARPPSDQGHRARPLHRPLDRARHGGRVFAQSEGEGRGATFTLELPRRAMRSSPRDMSRVLIVEDEQHIADGLRFNLEAEGHEAVVAADGEQALELLLERAAPFDVVVLDVMLPGKDGFTVASELRAAGQFVPILMLTARGRPEDVLRGFEAGADDYLPKPFELRSAGALNGLLRRRRWNEQDAGARSPGTGPTSYVRRPHARLRRDGSARARQVDTG